MSVPTWFWALGIMLAAIYAVTLVITLRRRRSKRPVVKGLTPLNRTVPPQPPVAELRGGARFGGMAITYPFATLKLYPAIDTDRPGALVISTQLTGPSVIPLHDISKLSLRSVGLGSGLHVTDAEGVCYDCSFYALSRADLLEALRRVDLSRLLAARR